jgi:hypothetical protein
MRDHPSYAIIFKAFLIDKFVARQFARLLLAAGDADVFLMLDETNGPAGATDYPNVIRYTEADLIERGFPALTQGPLFWYNADYPLYHFQHLHPKYDVVVMVEYDAVVQIDIGAVVQDFYNAELDFIGHPIAKTLDEYWWTGTMTYFYEREDIRPFLICFAIFSARAIQHLAACRLAHGQTDAVAEQWPLGECFVGTELSTQNFRVKHLSEIGQLTRYDWWPPVHEMELYERKQDVVLHPVLNSRRYVTSLFKNGYYTGFATIWRKNLVAMVLRCTLHAAWLWLRPGRRSHLTL